VHYPKCIYLVGGVLEKAAHVLYDDMSVQIELIQYQVGSHLFSESEEKKAMYFLLRQCGESLRLNFSMCSTSYMFILNPDKKDACLNSSNTESIFVYSSSQRKMPPCQTNVVERNHFIKWEPRIMDQMCN
jgi:hypothetical protein